MGRTRRALVVGLGVAGMSAAIGLRDAGWLPVIIERAPERRTGGYFVGVFPEGKKAAVELGAHEYLHVRNPKEGTSWSVDGRGRSVPGAGFLDRPGGPYAVLRGDIEAALWRALQGADDESVLPVEVRYGTSPVAIDDGPQSVGVTLYDSVREVEYTEAFDLVVGTDGLRSTVRSLSFGPHSAYIKQWNAIVCAFQLADQVDGFGPQDSITNAQPGRAAWVFGFDDRPPTALLTYRTKDVDAQFEKPRIETLREAYAGMEHPAVSHVLHSLETAPDFLFDSVNQVRMSTWHKGRVVLVGDAAWCLNLYSGMGATAAMRGGADLGRALRAHPDDLSGALEAWERGLRPFITKHMRLARIYQQLFVPSGRVTAGLRAALLRLLTALKPKATGDVVPPASEPARLQVR